LVTIASAYGIAGYVVDCAENLEEVLDSVSNEKGPVLLELRVSEEENVYPIVPSGTALHGLVMGPSLPTEV
jgi:acetolactate synthase-1/2/3 large subunit